MLLERYDIGRFVARYVPKTEQFLRALERVEARGISEGNEKLSARMRDSWTSGRFCFDYGIRKSFYVDAVYWAALPKHSDEVLEQSLRREMEAFADMRMGQLEAYDDKCRVSFAN
jgi:hypothetical protein